MMRMRYSCYQPTISIKALNEAQCSITHPNQWLGVINHNDGFLTYGAFFLLCQLYGASAYDVISLYHALESRHTVSLICSMELQQKETRKCAVVSSCTPTLLTHYMEVVINIT